MMKRSSVAARRKVEVQLKIQSRAETRKIFFSSKCPSILRMPKGKEHIGQGLEGEGASSCITSTI